MPSTPAKVRAGQGTVPDGVQLALQLWNWRRRQSASGETALQGHAAATGLHDIVEASQRECRVRHVVQFAGAMLESAKEEAGEPGAIALIGFRDRERLRLLSPIEEQRIVNGKAVRPHRRGADRESPRGDI